MHVVLFTSDDQVYAIPTGCVVEVVPAVEWRGLPQADAWVKGVFNYRGTLLPLLDFAVLLSHPVRALQRSSRILVIDRTARCIAAPSDSTAGEQAAAGRDAAPDVAASPSQLGLLVQRVLGSENLDFSAGTRPDNEQGTMSRFLGPVALTPCGTIQLIDACGL